MKKLSKKAQKEFFTKKGELKAIYKDIIVRFFNGTKVYPIDYNGSGRFTTISDKSQYVRNILDLLNYKFTEGNDAPRGSVTGNYFKISKTALVSVRGLLNF